MWTGVVATLRYTFSAYQLRKQRNGSASVHEFQYDKDTFSDITGCKETRLKLHSPYPLHRALAQAQNRALTDGEQHYYNPHFTDVKTESRRSRNYPKSHPGGQASHLQGLSSVTLQSWARQSTSEGSGPKSLSSNPASATVLTSGK